MLKRNIAYILSIGVIVLSGLLLSPSALAQNTCGTATDGTAINTSVIDCSGQGSQALWDLLRRVVRIMTGGVGVLAVGAVVFGAILYTMSGKKPERIQQAKTIWNNTVIGLAIFAFFAAITNFIIPGGVFG